MEIAARDFNRKSSDYKLSLHYHEKSLGLASSAQKMIEENGVEVIVGMGTWEEAVFVGNLGNRTQVPVISLVGPSIEPPLMQIRFPYLIPMDNDATFEMKCISDLICAYNWKKVVVIYEDDEHSSDFGALSLVNEALHKIGSELEHRLVLPPYSSLSDPKGFVLEALTELLSVQSRTFIVLRSSFPMASHIFSGAKKLGFLEKDCVWIASERVTSLIDFGDRSMISSMKGVLGIKSYHSTRTSSYENFKTEFRKMFGNNPDCYALRAYDSIGVISQALEKKSSADKVTLKDILSANFDGLSGKVSFERGKLVRSPIFRVVNVVDNNGYNELDYWTQEHGFSQSLVTEKGETESKRDSICRNAKGLSGSVTWPGNLQSKKPKGWAMPTISNPLKIAVPGDTQFNKFVTVDRSNKYSNEGYSGFCIQIFVKALKVLDYDIPYQFFEVNVDNYEELIQAVYNKTYDAIVGDVTILADRVNYVEFTQPYTESGLSMVVPIKSEESAWMFMKPFTWEMWVSTGVILLYTMLIVWFLEHQTNPEFNGSFKKQIGTALSFTFSSLFFAHKERVQSNITKVVLTMWLFVVFILTASYTANLSSMLTVRQLEPNIDIKWLKRTNQKVGCSDVIVRRYLENVLHFNPKNVYDIIPDENHYLERFNKKNITAAFFELPYEKVFLNKHCKDYTTTVRTYRFGGLGFVFQKGSPIVRDISEAILKLSEDGNITSLEKNWLTPSKECSSNGIPNNKTESLSLKSFWGIYLISGAISTFCFLLALARLEINHRCIISQPNGANQATQQTVLDLVNRYLYNGVANNRILPVSDSSSAPSSETETETVAATTDNGETSPA